MKLQDCTMGKIVCTRTPCGDLEKIGMIIGITNNCSTGDIYTRREPSRAIPEVKWADGSVSGIHCGNIEEFRDRYL